MLLLYLLPSSVPAILLIARFLHPKTLQVRAGKVLLGFWVLSLFTGLLVVASQVSERDNRLFASKIAALQLKGDKIPKQLLFIDYPPSRGLPFYLQANVLSVPVEALSKRNSQAYARFLRLLENPQPTLWFITDSLAGQAFLQKATDQGYRPSKLGSYYRFSIYQLTKRGQSPFLKSE